MAFLLWEMIFVGLVLLDAWRYDVYMGLPVLILTNMIIACETRSLYQLVRTDASLTGVEEADRASR